MFIYIQISLIGFLCCDVKKSYLILCVSKNIITEKMSNESNKYTINELFKYNRLL